MGVEVEPPPKHDNHIAELCKDIENLKVVQLRALCKELGVTVSGKKADLVLRVQEALDEESAEEFVAREMLKAAEPHQVVEKSPAKSKSKVKASPKTQEADKMSTQTTTTMRMQVAAAKATEPRREIVENSPAKSKAKVDASPEPQEADKMSRQTTTTMVMLVAPAKATEPHHEVIQKTPAKSKAGRPVVMGEEVGPPPKHDNHIAELCNDIENLKVVELRALCKEEGLKVSGNKADLVLRLRGRRK